MLADGHGRLSIFPELFWPNFSQVPPTVNLFGVGSFGQVSIVSGLRHPKELASLAKACLKCGVKRAVFTEFGFHGALSLALKAKSLLFLGV